MYLDVHFSCAQRMITPLCSDIQKYSLKDRVSAIFFSVFLIVDVSFHLLAATYKGFGWAAFQISRKNPPDYYKEAYSHFVKVLLYTPIIPFGSLVGLIRPSVFQKKKLQEYLDWKAPLINNSKTIENKKLKEELQSTKEEFERLKLQINSCDKIISPAISENDLPSSEDSLTGMVNPASLCTEDIVSVNSESDEEFVDALEDVSIFNKTLEKELLLKDQEIEKLKSQIALLNKTLSSTISQHKSLKENLFSAKIASSNSSSSEDIMSLCLEDKSVDATVNTSTLDETLEKELLLKDKEIEKLKSQVDLLNMILSPIGTLHSYNQILVIEEALHKSIGATSIIYGYLSGSVKEKIDKAFEHSAFKMNFLQFCHQETPHIESASQILKELLDEHSFRYWTNPKEGSICAIIKTLFGFI